MASCGGRWYLKDSLGPGVRNLRRCPKSGARTKRERLKAVRDPASLHRAYLLIIESPLQNQSACKMCNNHYIRCVAWLPKRIGPNKKEEQDGYAGAVRGGKTSRAFREASRRASRKGPRLRRDHLSAARGCATASDGRLRQRLVPRCRDQHGWTARQALKFFAVVGPLRVRRAVSEVSGARVPPSLKGQLITPREMTTQNRPCIHRSVSVAGY